MAMIPSTNDAVHPVQFLRRSLLYRTQLEAGANFGEVDGAAVALDYGDPAGEATDAQRLGLAEMSHLPRCGFKGAGTMDWLAGQGVRLPSASNLAATQPDESLAARLAPEELLILGSLDGDSDLVDSLEVTWKQEATTGARGYPLPRRDSHAWFLITGAKSAAMLAKLCGVDLRPGKFTGGQIAQTSVARLSAIVICSDLGSNDLGSTLAYHLLADSASAIYLWGCILDAMAEFDGRPIGQMAVKNLNIR